MICPSISTRGNRNDAVEQRMNSFRHHGLAVARRSIDEDGMPGVDRRAQLVEDRLFHDQVRKGLANLVIRGHLTRRLREVVHVPSILLQGDRRDAAVGVLSQETRRTLMAGFAEAITIGRAADHGAADDFAQQLNLEGCEDRLDHAEQQTETFDRSVPVAVPLICSDLSTRPLTSSSVSPVSTSLDGAAG